MSYGCFVKLKELCKCLSLLVTTKVLKRVTEEPVYGGPGAKPPSRVIVFGLSRGEWVIFSTCKIAQNLANLSQGMKVRNGKVNSECIVFL